MAEKRCVPHNAELEGNKRLRASQRRIVREREIELRRFERRTFYSLKRAKITIMTFCVPHNAELEGNAYVPHNFRPNCEGERKRSGFRASQLSKL